MLVIKKDANNTIIEISIPKIDKAEVLKFTLIFEIISTNAAEKHIGNTAINTRIYLPFSKPNKRVAGINTAVKNTHIIAVDKETS